MKIKNAIPAGTRRVIAEWIESIPDYPDMPGEANWDKAVWVNRQFPNVEQACAFSLKHGITGEGRARVEVFTEYPDYPGWGDWNSVELWIDEQLIEKNDE